MKVREVMSAELGRIEADETIAQAATQMKDRDVGLLPVVSAGRVVGVVSDRDLALRAVAPGLDPEATLVREVMTPDPVWCRASDDVEKASGLMRQMKVRRLLVADEEGQPVGVVSLGDLAANPQSAPQACEVLIGVCSDLKERPGRL